MKHESAKSLHIDLFPRKSGWIFFAGIVVALFPSPGCPRALRGAPVAPTGSPGGGRPGPLGAPGDSAVENQKNAPAAEVDKLVENCSTSGAGWIFFHQMV